MPAPGPAAARFARLASELGGEGGRPDAHRAGFGTGSLFVGRKMFALLADSGALVLKLPAPRVAELIADGTGTGWHPGAGPPLKEYLAVPFAHQRRWLALAREARAFMSPKR